MTDGRAVAKGNGDCYMSVRRFAEFWPMFFNCRSATAKRSRRRNSHDDLSPETADLARAMDSYKLVHRRRFITFEEMLAVVKSLGYHL
jgi:hypothetical protein